MTPALLAASGLFLAYVAGFFDGEGCIGFAHKKHPSGYEYHYPLVTVANTKTPVLDALAERFGGTVNRRPLQGKNHKPSWCWRTVGSRAIEFVHQIRPYLVLKAPQADLVFDWEEVRPVQGHRWDDATATFVAGLVSQMTELNRRGTA